MVVITDDTDSKASPSSPRTPFSSEAYSSMDNPPPAYGSSSSQSNYGAVPPMSPQSPQYYYSGPPTPQVYLLPVAAPAPARPKRSAARRFCRALFFAILLYSLFAGIVKLLALVFTGDIEVIDGMPSGPTPADGNSAFCYSQEPDGQTRWSLADFPYTRQNNYSLPVSSEYLYFISRGGYGSGSIRFELAKTEGDDIEVHTSIQARYQYVFDHVKVCSLSRKDGGNGVGFFTPERRISYPDHLIRFDTIVKIPLSKRGRIDIKRLETRMKNWEHEVGDLEGLVHFGEVDLDTTNSRIAVDSALSASNALIQTKNGQISGNFNVSDHLLLKTSNARIIGHINMLNKDITKPVKVDIKTTNGQIDTSVSLLSSNTPVTITPSYIVKASTSNSPLKFEVKDAVTSFFFPKLDLTAQTSNGRTDVFLHPTFEGSVFQQTSNARRSFFVGDHTVDPSGQGRRRSTLIKDDNKLKQQTVVWWGDQQQKPNMGTVRVKTSNAGNVVTVV